MSSKRPVYIILRQSPDWATQTYADLEQTRDFCKAVGLPEHFIIESVKTWDSTFGITFFAVRQAMKEISRDNLRSVHGATLVHIKQVRHAVDPCAFYLFTDDDDWYNPAIAETLSTIDPKACDAVLWNSALFGGGFELRNPDAFYTNAYAVSGAVLLQKPGNLDRVYQHFNAHATFIRSSYCSVLRRIGYASALRRLTVKGYRSIVRLSDHHLSVTNKHPASAVILKGLGDPVTPEKLRAMIRETIDADKKAVPPPQFAWTRPYTERVIKYYDCLNASAR